MVFFSPLKSIIISYVNFQFNLISRKYNISIIKLKSKLTQSDCNHYIYQKKKKLIIHILYVVS